MGYNAKKSWAKEFNSTIIAYPSEYVIRIFKGKYPGLDLSSEDFTGKEFCDSGFGCGRNLNFASHLGFNLSGFDIESSIVSNGEKKLRELGISVDLREGLNSSIPFDDNSFDYFLSWNSSYYMGNIQCYHQHLKEFYRVMRPSAKLIISVPMKSSFIFKNSEEYKDGYRVIKKDPFNCRNGEIMRCFEDENSFLDDLSHYFSDIRTGSIRDNCFGWNYHWHLAVCVKK